MQINSIISLIKSNSFEEARNLLEKCIKQPQFSKYEGTLSQLKVFFFTKEKKY